MAGFQQEGRARLRATQHSCTFILLDGQLIFLGFLAMMPFLFLIDPIYHPLSSLSSFAVPLVVESSIEELVP